jgi:Fe-S-cluster containining protein
VRRLAKFLGTTPRRFLREHARRVGDRISLKERENGDCVFLKDGRCSVYAAKPTNCSTYPFWPSVLESEETWASAAAVCEGIGQGDLYPREEIERLAAGDPRPLLDRHEAAAAGQTAARAADAPETPPAPAEPSPAAWEAALADLEALYADLDRELPRFKFTCVASGDCCDFDAFGHRLYASTLEAEWFFRRAPSERANANERHCPAWGKDRLCKAREGRMLGCRTFFCGPYPAGVPEDLYEPFHARIKAIHDKHGIPFRYRDVLDWSKERRPVAPAGDPSTR